MDADVVGNYSHLDLVLDAVAGVQAALVLLRLDDQEAVGARSVAGVEAVALQLAAIQSPQNFGQVGTELALQQRVVAHPHSPAPHGSI